MGLLVNVRPMVYVGLIAYHGHRERARTLDIRRWTLIFKEDFMTPSGKQYLREFLTAMVAYAVLTIGSAQALKSIETPAWRVLVALLPVIPLIFALLAFLRFLNRMDELERLIQLNAIGFAAGATALVSLTIGFLENAGFPRPSWIWIFPMMVIFWAIGQFLAARRYR